MNKQDIAFAKGLHKKMIIDKPKAIARYTKASLKNKGDQKPIQKKKISKADRLKTPFVMFNDKKYHSL